MRLIDCEDQIGDGERQLTEAEAENSTKSCSCYHIFLVKLVLVEKSGIWILIWIGAHFVLFS